MKLRSRLNSGMIDIDIEEERNKYFKAIAERTFQYDERLPSLPIPKLEDTLKKYLESVKPHVNDDEYEVTKTIVLDFEEGIGSQLQLKLLDRFKYYRNWLEDWWEKIIYLKPRIPLLPFVNLATCFPCITTYDSFPENFFLERSSIQIYHYVLFWKMLREEQLPPQKSKTSALDMNQWKRLFNCCRIPGLQSDKFAEFFNLETENYNRMTHLSVLHRGHVFILDSFYSDNEPLTPPEISNQLEYIINYCKNLLEGQSIGALTCGNRTFWHQVRHNLIKMNTENENFLQLIESSMFTVVLDDRCPSSSNEELLETMGGDVKNRWADKSLQLIIFANGMMANNCDHGPFDALPLLSLNYFSYLRLLENNFQWRGVKTIRSLNKPRELIFYTDNSIKIQVEEATDLALRNISKLEVYKNYFYSFGKEVIKKHRTHPDTFVQMALQLAYYKLYNRPAPTYETASTRMFYHGRTETVRSCTVEAITWAKSMLDPSTSTERKLQLLEKAFDKHNLLMKEAMKNKGCDRHLLGLYLIALEEDKAVPKLFLDSSYVKSGGNGNFILSTSLSGYTIMQGAVAPMCLDGYGVFYSILKNSIQFVITTWNTSSETNGENLYTALCNSLLDMNDLMTSYKTSC